MVKYLRNISLGMLVSAFLISAFTVQVQAQELTKLWERSNRTGADEGLPAWFETSMIRGIAEYDGKIYLPDRAATTIRVIDALTGEDVALDTDFDLDGVAGGTYALNDLKISEDGAIFLGNLTVDASASDFKLYWWTSEGGTFDGSFDFTSEGRLGDHFSVVGSLADNTVEIWIPEASTDPGVVHVLTTDDNGATWTDNPITLSGSNVVIGSGAQAVAFAAGGDSDFYIASNSSAPARYNKDGEYIENSAFSSASRNGFSLFTADGVDYAAMYSFRADGAGGGDKVGRAIVYDISDATDPTIVHTTDLVGDEGDYFSSVYGDVAVWVNDDESFSFAISDGVNGFVAYTTAADAPDVYVDAPTNKIFFSEYIEGSSNNKALEIYNATDSTITLVNYRIAQTSNGSEWRFFEEFAEGATIGAGEVYTLGSDAISEDLFDINDLDEIVYYPGPVYHTGDDARALIHINPVTNDTTWIDVFGEELIRPDTGWDVAGVAKATQDHTLIRKPSVTQGNPTPMASFGTDVSNSEWIVMPMNFFENLGKPSSDLAAPFSGDFFIPEREGDAQGFASLSEAFAAISEFGLSGPTALYITDDIDETGEIKLDRSDLTEDTPLLIKPAEGVSPTITLISGSGTDGIWLRNADYVTFDGSNTDGGDTRDMTFTSDDPAMSTMVYVYQTVNSTFKNSNFFYTGDKSISAFVPNESGSIGTQGWSIINNTIGSEDGDFKTGVGLWGFGEGATELKDTKVIDNDIYTTHRGITSWWATNNDIIGNTITIASPIADQAWYGAIYLALNNGETNIIGNTIQGLQVNRTASASYSAGILFNASLGEVNIFNNIITAENFANADAAEGNRVFAIGINNAAGNSVNKVYHNSIRLGDSDETGTQAAFGLITVGSSAQDWDLKNNLFTVDTDAENATVYRVPTDFGFSSDYNNFAFGDNAYLSTMGTTEDPILESTDFATWLTDSGQDANSSNVSVEYISGTDLRLTGSSVGDVNLAGMPLAEVTTDIDGNDRSDVLPYKGAFEAEAFDVATEIDDKPLAYSLSQNYPNPFNPTSNIQFTLPQSNHVRIDVYNINGQLVQTLVNTNMTAGEHTVTFNARNLASGVYIYRIVAGNFVQSKRMTLIK